MTHTITRDDRLTGPEPAPAAPPLAPPPKLRRRPALIAVAVASICLGALLAAWAWTSTTNTQEVLAARDTISRGAVITSDDITRVRINADPALAPLPASSYDDVIGQRAALDIGAGSLLTESATTSELLPPDGMSVVGVALSPAQAPGLSLEYGDKVRVVVTPGEGAAPPSGSPPFSDAEVVGTRVDEMTGELVVDLLVPHGDATLLASRVSTGNVALILDSGEK
ncbi:SAF domain-containing protein [Nocardioides sp.]|uniref:SAF domain-containing protein n=1 Tax=Nocardioides sp. TaxID=35761 RepID=UPI002B5AAC02|nr:SAF domain-containing protein [Nocardioides sp.]HXH78409.1 SAF domain-containing protein [Nocardioides sp.]